MKLDWEINNYRVLVAEAGAVTYYVAPGAVNLWRPRKQYNAFDGKAATVWSIEGGMSLTNAIAMCERDAERPEGCPAPAPSTQAPEPPSVEEQIENLAWGLKNETKRAAERDNEIAERLGAYEAWLTQFVASKCRALDLRINERLKKLEAEASVHERSLSFHAKRLEKLEAKA